ncbi:hypothetical protein NL676_018793 [Syzygium grande]|nr:hypothetical protein NL676_018793 [Syzygium grande]
MLAGAALAPPARALDLRLFDEGALAPCIPCARSGTWPMPTACSNKFRLLNSAAKTIPDRQGARKCLEVSSGSISGLNYGVVAGSAVGSASRTLSAPALAMIGMQFHQYKSIFVRNIWWNNENKSMT